MTEEVSGKKKKFLRGLFLVAFFFVTFLFLYFQGRPWWCSCRDFFLWKAEAWSSHTSQHMFDPYSFTHILHGVFFCGMIYFLAPKLSFENSLGINILLESGWEMLENSEIIISRFREGTAAYGYFGDSIINSFGDIFRCGLGFSLAYLLGFKRSLAFFCIIEILLILAIRDSLVLNIIQLIHPLELIKTWQLNR